MNKEKQIDSLEEKFTKAEAILEAMEAEETTLEQSFAYYEEGMKLLKQCHETIDQVEKQVLKISGEGETDVFQ